MVSAAPSPQAELRAACAVAWVEAEPNAAAPAALLAERPGDATGAREDEEGSPGRTEA